MTAFLWAILWIVVITAVAVILGVGVALIFKHRRAISARLGGLTKNKTGGGESSLWPILLGGWVAILITGWLLFPGTMDALFENQALFWGTVILIPVAAWLLTRAKEKKAARFLGKGILAILFLAIVANSPSLYAGAERDFAPLAEAIGSKSATQTSSASTATVLGSSVIAPVGMWSEILRVSGNKCVRWWGEDPTGKRFLAQYYDPYRNVWVEYTDGDPNLTGVRFTSTTGSPEQVYYEITSKGMAACATIP